MTSASRIGVDTSRLELEARTLCRLRRLEEIARDEERVARPVEPHESRLPLPTGPRHDSGRSGVVPGERLTEENPLAGLQRLSVAPFATIASRSLPLTNDTYARSGRRRVAELS